MSLLAHGNDVRQTFKDMRLAYYGAILFLLKEHEELQEAITGLPTFLWLKTVA